MIDVTKLPRDLPERPDGWRKMLVTHLRLGGGEAVANFAIHDDAGVEMPFQFAYRVSRNKKESYRGYFLYGGDECLTWSQLRKRWPQFLKVCTRLTAADKNHPANFGPGTGALPMFVIYDHPKDRPAGFVVRSWDVFPGGRVALNATIAEDLPSLDDARKHVPDGLRNIGRNDDDDPVIAEVWL